MLARHRLLCTMCVAAAILAVGSSARVATQSPGQRINVLINFATPPGAADRALVTAAGGRVRFVYAIVPAIAADLPTQAVAALAANPRVRFIEPDAEVMALDAELDNSWGVQRIGAGTAHDQDPPIVGSGVRVAIIDSGIDYGHPELAGTYAGGWDFVNNDADPMDDCGHGTHVAGIVGARKDATGVVGVAPGVALYALKALGRVGNNCSGSLSGILAAVDWAVQHGIQITNNSYGSTAPSATADQAYANAAALGMIHIAAAGNSGNCDATGTNVLYPGGYRSVTAVANLTAADVRSCSSSTGPAVEVSAPGSQINSTIPGGLYGVKGGTSMASPHVAGMAALLLASGVDDANGNGRNNDEIRNAIAGSTADLGAVGRDPLYGFGRVDVPGALALGAAAPPLTVSVHGIGYTPSGNGKVKKDLIISLATVYGVAAPIGATVSARVYVNGALHTTVPVTTDLNGVGSTLLRNTPTGTYRIDVAGVSAGLLTWDGVTPPNSYVK